MRLREIMSSPVWTITPDVNAEEAFSRMQRERVHHLAVIDHGRLIGVVSSHDLAATRNDREEHTVGDVMSPSAITATEHTTVREAANLMRGNAIGCLPVVDGKKIVGMITVSDLLELVGRGAQKPVKDSTRWTLRDRGPRHQRAERPAGR